MTWYAIRTTPGSQAPRRERWVEPSASALKGQTRGKGYRIASSIDPERSAIEMALETAGIVHYMPAEFAAVRNRHRKGLYELRRYALIHGYAFVSEMEMDAQWARLLAIPGVKDVVMTADGKPYPIDAMDIFRLRMFEAHSRAAAADLAKRLSAHEEREGRKAAKKAAKAARKKMFPGRAVRLIWGREVGRDATVTAWQGEEHVKVLVQKLDGADKTVTVPYGFLKSSVEDVA